MSDSEHSVTGNARWRARGWLWLAVRATVVVVLGAPMLPSCRHDLVPGMIPDTAYQCLGEIVRYGILDAAPSASVLRPPPGSHAWPKFNKTDAGVFPRFYLQSSGNTHGPLDIPAELRDLYLLQMETKRTHHGATYLEVDFADPLDRLYVAFDTQAEPPWLNLPGWRKTSLVVTSTQHTAGPLSPNVQYRLFEAIDPTFGGSKKLMLPGNSYQVTWPGTSGGKQYFVLASAQARPDVSKIVERFPFSREFCTGDTLTPADVYSWVRRPNELEAALEEWLKKGFERYRPLVEGGFLEFKFAQSGCGPVPDPKNPAQTKSCSAKSALTTSSPVEAVNGWPVRSIATLDPSRSWIRFERQGEAPKTTPLNGRVSFAVRDGGRLDIDEITFFGGPAVTLSGQSVAEVSLGQRGSFAARCDDPIAPGPPFALCRKYVLEPSALQLGGFATIAGTRIAARFENAASIAVQVDLDAWEFSLGGGPVRQDLSAGGTNLKVDLHFGVVGAFQDFAPVASFAEARDRFPCVDSNSGVVLLDGQASLDVGPAAAPIASHTWIEDAGLLSAKVLGSGKTLTLPMSVGFHDVTLIVTDIRGVPSQKTLRVEVYDDAIDDLQLPPDRFVQLPVGSSAVQVDIGTATEAERCSGGVSIENDAPADRRFPAGLTEVLWTVDDFNGNVVWHRQKIFVSRREHHPPPIASLSGTAILSPGGAQVLQYSTKAQGTVFAADEYLVIRDPDGIETSVDPQGALRGPGQVGPRARSRRVGGQDTQGTFTVSPFSASLPALGRYEATYALVVPGGSFSDPGDVVALARFSFAVEP